MKESKDLYAKPLLEIKISWGGLLIVFFLKEVFMDYRMIPNTNVKVSTIGVGGSHLHEIDEQKTIELID